LTAPNDTRRNRKTETDLMIFMESPRCRHYTLRIETWFPGLIWAADMSPYFLSPREVSVTSFSP
jgi:hypothetical protein